MPSDAQSGEATLRYEPIVLMLLAVTPIAVGIDWSLGTWPEIYTVGPFDVLWIVWSPGTTLVYAVMVLWMLRFIRTGVPGVTKA